MTLLSFRGRVLFLSGSPDIVKRQMLGEDISLVEAGPLRSDISTDEITPARYCTVWGERLGKFPYTGFAAQGEYPIGIDAVKHAAFEVTVAGKRYGKGSSREHSPFAERSAGIRLVIAESFERIYRQNADNIGLFTSTDFGLVDRIQRGEAIPVEELVASRDSLAATVLRIGGLLQYGRQHLRTVQRGAEQKVATPLTLAQKILAEHRVVTADTNAPQRAGMGIFVRPDWRFIVDPYTPMCAEILHSEFGQALVLHDPESIVLFEDHFTYVSEGGSQADGSFIAAVQSISREHRKFVSKYGLRHHGSLGAGPGSEGISHPLMTERYALPCQIVIGTDSHTTHSGALGCLAFGVGTTDIANSLVTGAVRITVPESLRVDLIGRLPSGVTAKDIVLHLLADPEIRAGSGVGRVFEFTGPVIAQLSMDERATLTNMTAELGGFTGLIAPDAVTVDFLRARRGIEFKIEPWMRSDAAATFARTICIDCSILSPTVASPGDPGNGVPISSLVERPKIQIAYGGSCTGGKREDFDHYHEVLAWAVARGLRVRPEVRLYLQFGSLDVRRYCEEKGYLSIFEQAGAKMLEPACGACINCGPGTSTEPSEITISAINRNFPGRSGPGQVWLGSPPTVAASAIAGEIVSFDELRSRSQ